MSAWKNDFIKINPYSRPADKLLKVKKIVAHYTANPGASARNHVKYFGETLPNLNEKLPKEDRRYASAHIFVDRKEAICILPLDEVAYHANDRTLRIPELKATAPYYRNGNANLNTIGVEMCIEKDGSIHPDTLKRTEDVFVELIKMFNLDPINDILTHNMITGKLCPKPWVINPSEYVKFKNNVKQKLDILSVPKEQPKEEMVKEAMSMKISDFISTTEFKKLEIVINQAKKDGFIYDDEFEKYSKKLIDKSITIGEVAYLSTLIPHRRFTQK